MIMEDKFHQHPANPDLLKRSSERSFGFVMTIFFALVGIWPALSNAALHYWSLGVSLIFLFFSVFRPSTLELPNKAWLKLGLLLNRIVSPLVLTTIFVILFVPLGIIFKLMKKDLLKLQLDKNRMTYWQLREPPGPNPETMINQF